MSAPERVEGDLREHLLPGVLAEIQRRGLEGRLEILADGETVLDLCIVGDGAAATAGNAEERVSRAARLASGRFRLLPNGEVKGKTVPLPRLVLVAARALDDPARVRAALGGLDAPLALTTLGETGGGDLGLNAQEGFLLSRVDGRTGAHEICQLSPTDEDETLRALYALTAAGLIRLSRPQPTAKKPSNALSKLEGFLQRTRTTAGEAGPAPQEPAPGAAAAARKESTPRAPASAEHQRLLQRLNVADKQNHYEILGLTRDASIDEIRKTYFLLARQFHPDHFHRVAVRDLQPALEKLFARMTQAYQTLCDPAARQEFDGSLRHHRGDSRAVQEKAAREVADENFRHARKLLAKGQFVKALPYLENAAKANDAEAQYLETLGSVQSLNPRFKADAETNLRKAVARSKSRASGYLMLGLHYARCGRNDEARRLLREAMSWDASCEAARIILPSLDGGGKDVADGATRVIRQILQTADEDEDSVF